ncbi:MAG: hypothetical protein ACI9FB_004050, partial [Candidatus Azotimanducaceae bacterium]
MGVRTLIDITQYHYRRCVDDRLCRNSAQK